MSTVVETITINGIEYVKKDAITETKPIGEVRIIVADRGWVFVGNCQDNEDGSVTITNAKNIRLWGTTNGLGELANGPTSATKADYCGTVRCTPIVTIGVNMGW